MNPDHNFYVAHCVDEPIFSTEISKIFNTCNDSKNLMIGIYLIEDDRFLYCNKIFEKLIGFDAHNLVKNGWQFWFSLIVPHEVSDIKNKIFSFFTTPLVRDIITLQYHINNINGKQVYIRHEILIYKLKNRMFALNYFFDISEKEEIERCVKNNGGHRGRNFLKNQLACISSREEEVLKLIADGFSSKEIAEKLFISNHTAISHRKHLIQKFRVKNTAQLIKKASKVLEL
ncbi:response regulator transcription factor [Aquimarina mytili]|uniref:Helix-turn-helix transcriptional regulator n=1 Tax=Aquimarina mytili TaxID=874423 RepID=A0A936ZX35_9FLAO|nr:helix-turn-helix transcriptional regulator [Aquimarina mytili]MBL0683856.1 helix-turn-helix transcriptional regulator [Aquimarina mytili]